VAEVEADASRRLAALSKRLRAHVRQEAKVAHPPCFVHLSRSCRRLIAGEDEAVQVGEPVVARLLTSTLRQHDERAALLEIRDELLRYRPDLLPRAPIAPPPSYPTLQSAAPSPAYAAPGAHSSPSPTAYAWRASLPPPSPVGYRTSVGYTPSPPGMVLPKRPPGRPPKASYTAYAAALVGAARPAMSIAPGPPPPPPAAPVVAAAMAAAVTVPPPATTALAPSGLPWTLPVPAAPAPTLTPPSWGSARPWRPPAPG
jgi:hypothetical protein